MPKLLNVGSGLDKELVSHAAVRAALQGADSGHFFSYLLQLAREADDPLERAVARYIVFGGEHGLREGEKLSEEVRAFLQVDFPSQNRIPIGTFAGALKGDPKALAAVHRAAGIFGLPNKVSKLPEYFVESYSRVNLLVACHYAILCDGDALLTPDVFGEETSAPFQETLAAELEAMQGRGFRFKRPLSKDCSLDHLNANLPIGIKRFGDPRVFFPQAEGPGKEPSLNTVQKIAYAMDDDNWPDLARELGEEHVICELKEGSGSAQAWKEGVLKSVPLHSIGVDAVRFVKTTSATVRNALYSAYATQGNIPVLDSFSESETLFSALVDLAGGKVANFTSTPEDALAYVKMMKPSG